MNGEAARDEEGDECYPSSPQPEFPQGPPVTLAAAGKRNTYRNFFFSPLLITYLLFVDAAPEAENNHVLQECPPRSPQPELPHGPPVTPAAAGGKRKKYRKSPHPLKDILKETVKPYIEKFITKQ